MRKYKSKYNLNDYIQIADNVYKVCDVLVGAVGFKYRLEALDSAFKYEELYEWMVDKMGGYRIDSAKVKEVMG